MDKQVERDMMDEEDLEDFERKKKGLDAKGRPKKKWQAEGGIVGAFSGGEGVEFVNTYLNEGVYDEKGKIIPPPRRERGLAGIMFEDEFRHPQDGEEIMMAHPTRESANRRVTEEMYQLRNKLIQLSREQGCAGCGGELGRNGGCAKCMGMMAVNGMEEEFFKEIKTIIQENAETAMLRGSHSGNGVPVGIFSTHVSQTPEDNPSLADIINQPE